MPHQTLAAVDLGSNSFHLQIARVVDHQLYALDNLKETVRLGAGVTPDKQIDAKNEFPVQPWPEIAHHSRERIVAQQSCALHYRLN